MEHNLELKVMQPKIKDKEDTFWYSGQIAYINMLSGNRLYLEATGEKEVIFEENGSKYKGQNAVDEAISRGWKDDDLLKLNKHDGMIMNNWFVVIKCNEEGEVISDDLAICDDYNHGVEMLNLIAKQEQNKEYK